METPKVPVAINTTIKDIPEKCKEILTINCHEEPGY